MTQTTAVPTLLEAAWPQASHGFGLVAAVGLGVGVLALSAKAQVPFWPVPMTMQTLVVLVLGMAYGTWLALATVIAYLLIGAAGLPVFAGTPERGVGLAYMAGPTAGFLVGFVLGSVLASALGQRDWDKGFLTCIAAMLLGHVLIVLAGVSWLVIQMGLRRGIEVGLVPFLLPGLAKSLLGGLAVPLLWRTLGVR